MCNAFRATRGGEIGAAAIFVVIGAAGLYFGQDLAFGSSARMGPGYFPTLLSILIIAVGLVLAFRALTIDGPPIERIQFRPLFAILAAILAFGALIDRIGLALTTALLTVEGRLRVLGVSTAKRLLSQPDIPTMTESGIPMDLSLWWGVLVPAATPDPIVNKINGWFAQIVGSEETRKFLADSGADPMINSPAKAQEMFLTAIKEWGEYVRMAKIPLI